ncbi:MAG: hypothetical protein RLZZ200_2801 [Pseudomonadota bacterium]|jgi:purine-binding chemotaxis protein CheW
MTTDIGTLELTARQVLTFHLGGEVYGIDILGVREIRGWTPVTKLPSSSEWILGVLNLRGTVVPVLDMRLRFALGAAEFTPTTAVIVVSVEGSDGPRLCGIVVDEVDDVVDLKQEALRAAPALTHTASSAYLKNLAVVGETMVMLLDTSALLAEELRGFEQAA